MIDGISANLTDETCFSKIVLEAVSTFYLFL